MPVNGRQKGARGEREFCQFLRARGYRARRSQQYQGVPDEDAADVISALDALFYVDVKRTERLAPIEWLKKALSDRGSKQPHRKPLIAWKKNRGDWIAMISVDDLLALVRGGLPEPFSEPLGDHDEPTEQRLSEAAPSGQLPDTSGEAR